MMVRLLHLDLSEFVCLNVDATKPPDIVSGGFGHYVLLPEEKWSKKDVPEYKFATQIILL